MQSFKNSSFTDFRRNFVAIKLRKIESFMKLIQLEQNECLNVLKTTDLAPCSG